MAKTSFEPLYTIRMLLTGCKKNVKPLSWTQTDITCSFFCRMHLALKAYQELLLTVNEMDRSQDEGIRQSSNVIKSKMLVALYFVFKIRYIYSLFLGSN